MSAEKSMESRAARSSAELVGLIDRILLQPVVAKELPGVTDDLVAALGEVVPVLLELDELRREAFLPEQLEGSSDVHRRHDRVVVANPERHGNPTSRR